jgi:hypothetical protein
LEISKTLNFIAPITSANLVGPSYDIEYIIYVSYIYVCLWTFRLSFYVYRLLLPYQTYELPF